MTKRMLIDATYPEQTRVAVVSNNKLEEYDFETINRKQLKSNIYLVKVTRVEPSLQAAFVDFGGNRHGFLPFPEIHPDYYRIPIADREAILAEERAQAEARAAAEAAAEEAALKEGDESVDSDENKDNELFEIKEVDIEEETYVLDGTDLNESDIDEELAEEISNKEELESGDSYDLEMELSTKEGASETHKVIAENFVKENVVDKNTTEEEGDILPENKEVIIEDDSKKSNKEKSKSKEVENVGGDVIDPPSFRSNRTKRYKIQEVIKRNQIMLIQISKEERGNKGAAVTSYISLPGRYCVLMPNSPRGGGVSRKVSNMKDRQRLKKILNSLNVPDGMSVILRTAGVARTEIEIKRDLEYLLCLWNEIRELTLKSTAPALIYEEGSLIKRAIRDLYRRDIDEVCIAGEKAFDNAKQLMNTLVPGHENKIKLYKDNSVPLFFRYQVENQIDEIYSTTVYLKSGGSIVINPTEALVAIDVNSGKATKGRHIEETALKTNLEAAEEVARQIRLRDQGGLVVIDFIDMEETRNNRMVERKLKNAMRHDRARIQIGRISPFGLMELSRQRLTPSIVETSFETCIHCEGRGVVRTIETSGIRALRAIEEECLKGKASEIKVSLPNAVALYILNSKKDALFNLEKKYEMSIVLHIDKDILKPNYLITVTKTVVSAKKDLKKKRQNPIKTIDMPAIEKSDDSSEIDPDSNIDSGNISFKENNEGEAKDTRPRRRGRRGGKNRGRNRNNKNTDENIDENIDENNVKDNQRDEETSNSEEKSSASKKPRNSKRRYNRKKPVAKSSDSESGIKYSDKSKPLPKPSEKITLKVPANGSSKERKGWWKRLIE